MASIGRTAARGVAWGMSIGVGARVVQLIGTLILTRFIAPDDYGAVLAASIAVQAVGQLSSFAFGQYLIARRSTPDVAFQAATLHLALGVGAMSLLWLFRAPLADAFDLPSMREFVWGFAVAHLIDRVRYVPERLLMRDLRFRRIAVINGIGELVFTATALSLASAFGPYAIMGGFMARAIITAVLFLAVSPRAGWLVYAPLQGDVVRGLFGYGLPIMIGAVADLAATRWDNLVVSKLFGATVMGRYTLAYSLAEMPVSHVAEHIGNVLMPSFSRMEPAQRRAAVVRAAALLSLVASPLGIGLGAVAPTVVAAMFDARWAPMGPMLSILAVVVVFRPMTWAGIAYLQAVQQTRLIMIMSFVRAAVLLSMVATLGALGGPLWACAGAGIGLAFHTVVTIVWIGRTTGLAAGAYLLGVARPLLACVPMFPVVMVVREGMAALGAATVVSLAVEIAAGGVVYVVAALLIARPTARELLRLARRTRGPEG